MRFIVWKWRGPHFRLKPVELGISPPKHPHAFLPKGRWPVVVIRPWIWMWPYVCSQSDLNILSQDMSDDHRTCPMNTRYVVLPYALPREDLTLARETERMSLSQSCFSITCLNILCLDNIKPRGNAQKMGLEKVLSSDLLNDTMKSNMGPILSFPRIS